MEQATVLTTLARFIAELRFEDLPAEVTELAKTRLLDGLACSIAGRDLPASLSAWRAVKGNRGEASIIAREEKVPAADAALVNGVMGHSLLQEDWGPGAHPATVIVPVALAVGEQVGAGGKQVIAAIVAGYEVAGRIEQGTTQHLARRGFRTLPVIGPIASAATAGHLLQFTPAELAQAVAFAANLSSGLYQGFAEGTMEAYYHAGFAARNGVTAAQVAHAGGIASPWSLEGAHGFFRTFCGTTEKAAAVTEALGERYAILRTRSKPYPTSRNNQQSVDFARELGRRIGDPTRISFIVQRIPARAEATPGRNGLPPFQNMLQAQMSVRFCAAAAILGRPVESFTFFRDHFDDAEVSALVRRMHLVGEEGRTRTRLEVHLNDGETLVAETDRDWPPTQESLTEKFVDLAGHFLGPARTQRAIDGICRLERLDDIRELTACFSGRA